MNIKQIKLPSNEEVICKVVSGPDDNEEMCYIIKDALVMETVYSNSGFIYSFKPLLHDQISNEGLISINSLQIVAMATAPESLIQNYNHVIEKYKSDPTDQMEYDSYDLEEDTLDTEDVLDYLQAIRDKKLH